MINHCSPEHQKLDYKWEHKLECGPIVSKSTASVNDSVSKGGGSAQAGEG